MIRKTQLGMVLAIICALIPGYLLAQTLCETEQTRWADAFASLQRDVNEHRNAKQESITPKIQHLISGTARVDMAGAIQYVLKDRKNRLSELEETCRRSAEVEKSAYEQWRRCGGSGKKGASASSGPGAVAREREKLLAELQELLLDEAYVQYKNDQSSPSSYSQERQQQDRWMGGQYQNSWPGYQGYYR